MVICHCHGITERQLHHAVAEGAETLFDVMGCLGAGTGCGNCQVDVREVLESARAAHASVTQSATQSAAQSAGCSSTSRMTPIRTSVGNSLNTLK